MNTEEITGLIISRSRLYIFVRTSSSWFLLNITCSHRHKMLFTALCCLVQVQPVINWMSLFFIVFPLIVVVCRLALQSRAKSFPFDCVLSFRLRLFLHADDQDPKTRMHDTNEYLERELRIWEVYFDVFTTLSSSDCFAASLVIPCQSYSHFKSFYDPALLSAGFPRITAQLFLRDVDVAFLETAFLYNLKFLELTSPTTGIVTTGEERETTPWIQEDEVPLLEYTTEFHCV